MFYYLGIDIAGKRNTWAVALRFDGDRLILSEELSLKIPSQPRCSELKEVLKFCQENKVLGCSIDAPLSFSISIEDGLRKSDKKLKELLSRIHPQATRWVVSYNTLMAVPLRGFLLAEAINPYCGTIVETHPRASLLFCLSEESRHLAIDYKKEPKAVSKYEKDFKRLFESGFRIRLPKGLKLNDGVIDAIVCGFTAFLFARAPESLEFLPSESQLRGFGPFVVIRSFKF